MNEVSFFYFNTACSSSISSAIDSFGVIAVLCNQIIHLYSINGTYLNVSITNSISNPYQIGFDGFGYLIISASDGLHVFH